MFRSHHGDFNLEFKPKFLDCFELLLETEVAELAATLMILIFLPLLKNSQYAFWQRMPDCDSFLNVPFPLLLGTEVAALSRHAMIFSCGIAIFSSW